MKMFVIALSMLFTTSVSAQDFVHTDKYVQIATDDQNCTVQTQLPWCSHKVKSDRKLTVDDITKADRFIFSYLRKQETDNLSWSSHYASVADHTPFQGDCDGFVFTMYDYLNHYKFDLSKAYRVLVSKNGSITPDHMIAVIEIDHKLWVFADSSAEQPYLLSDIKYKILYVAPVNDTKWYVANN